MAIFYDVNHIYHDPGVTIEKAASRAMGDRLRPLMELCESQKTVSTRRLRKYIEELAASDCQDAVHFRELAKFVRQHSAEAKP